MKLMCLGDSITRGQEGGYRIPLAARLRDGGTDFTFVGSRDDQGPHEGYPGFGIRALLEGHAHEQFGTSREITVTLGAYEPDVLLLMAGTNDVYFGHPRETFTTLKELIDRALACRPRMTIFVASILPIAPGRKPWGAVVPDDVVTRVPEFNGCIAGYVTALQDAGRPIHFVDIYRTVTGPEELGPDGVHPLPPVFTKMAQAWFDALQSVPGSEA